MKHFAQKRIYMLIGPKGSGKTFIGTLVEENSDIRFLRVESIWLSLNKDEKGWRKVEDSIDAEFKNCDKVMIENLGAGVEFNNFKNNLMEKYEVKLIKVKTDPDICLRRVKKRDKSEHIPVSDHKVEQYNKIASKVELAWDLIIENNSAEEKYITEQILSL